MINLSSLHPIPISNSDTLNSILALGVRIAMQDKVTSNIVERICTTLLIPPVMGWHDMYSIYNLPGQYIAYRHMHLLY
jgi:hypothetical protein